MRLVKNICEVVQIAKNCYRSFCKGVVYNRLLWGCQKIVSNNPGLVDFVITLVSSVLNNNNQKSNK